MSAPHWSEALIRLGACPKGVEFARQYPDWPSAWAACQNVDWLIWAADRAGAWTDTLRAESERVAAPAWAEYERVKASALAECERVKASALAEYERVTSPAWAEYERVTSPAWAEYKRVKASALAEYERVLATAVRALVHCPMLPT